MRNKLMKMMRNKATKMIISFFTIVIYLLVSTMGAGVYATPVPANSFAIYVDGRQVQFEPTAQPFIDSNSRTQIPIRFVAEELGLQVNWDNVKRQATVTDGTKKIVLTIGSYDVIVDGKAVRYDTTSFIKGNRTFCSIRIVSELFGCKVEWKMVNNVNVIEITTPNNVGNTGAVNTAGFVTARFQNGADLTANAEVIKGLDGVAKSASLEKNNPNADIINLYVNGSKGPARTITVEYSISNDYELRITPITWGGEGFHDDYTVATEKVIKEIISKYFPKSSDKVVKYIDDAFNVGIEHNKAITYDERQLTFTQSGMGVNIIIGYKNKSFETSGL